MAELLGRHPFWLLALMVPALIAIGFSLTQNPSVRRFRNWAMLGCYGVGMAMSGVLPWREALVTWAIPGLVSGVLMFGYEAWQLQQADDPEARLSTMTVPLGLLAWPVMLPEVVENLLAEATMGSRGSEND